MTSSESTSDVWHIQRSPKKDSYEVILTDGERILLPSVTSVIKATVPIPFSVGAWWGYKLGVQAGAAARGEIAMSAESPNILALAKKIGPHPNKPSGAQRGLDIHEAIATWATSFEPPDPANFPAEQRGMVKGLVRWLLVNRPEFLLTEQILYSLEDGYAGTLDAEVEFRAGPRRGTRSRLDWKTGGFYPNQHLPQILAYEHAAVLGGGEPSQPLVVQIPPDGVVCEHEPGTYTFEDFEVLLRAFQRQLVHG